MWKCGFLLFLLFHSFTAQAVPDSLLYPKAQLDAFKDRVAAAKKYADSKIVLFRSIPQAPALYWSLYKADIAEAIPAIQSSTSPEQPLKNLYPQNASDSLLLTFSFLSPQEEVYKSLVRDPARAFHYRGKTEESLYSSNLKTVGYKGKSEKWIYEKELSGKATSETSPYDQFFVLLASHKPRSQNIPLSYSRCIHYFQKLTAFGVPACPLDVKKDFAYPVVTAATALSAYLDTLIPMPFEPDSMNHSDMEGLSEIRLYGPITIGKKIVGKFTIPPMLRIRCSKDLLQRLPQKPL